ncbi:hypothetical protein PQE66_gp089 [Bacillus phage PBC2]|uniref:Uncharacterized protein n=1 Tax=Bacillus phage PBC2 TaxID=1675029 RepID=A0A218KBY9_9CAUD|nr:hypothetical protein PQE66_gp089 [Bacillus phage PBC2]AKQ08404.1 hypothetical protein PBC2_089 [Bacillus phage PBC2]
MEKVELHKELLENAYNMVSSIVLLSINGQIPELTYILEQVGISAKEMDEVTEFISKIWSAEDLDELTAQRAKLVYLDAFREVVKLKEIAKGYEEMGAINLQIAEEDKHLEDEGEKLVNEEVDKKKAEGTTEEE